MLNPTFKKPNGWAPVRVRSPSPPRAFVEPLSPARPRPIEPNFNYPAINEHVEFNVQKAPPFNATTPNNPHFRNGGSSQKSQHGRTPSIDTLAEAALAVNSSFQTTMGSGARDGHTQLYSNRAGADGAEPPHKRARSAVLPSPLVAQFASRPATSYAPTNGRVGETIPQSRFEDAYDSRVEEAALLLNFRTGGWPNNATSVDTLSNGDQWNASRPHARSFPQESQLRPTDLLSEAASLPPTHPFESQQSWTNLSTPAQPAAKLPASVEYPEGSDGKKLQAEQVPNGSLLCHPEEPMEGIQHDHNMSPAATKTGATSTPAEGGGAPIQPTKGKRGWPKGKPRGPQGRKGERGATKRSASQKKAVETAKTANSTTDPFGANWGIDKDMSFPRRKSISETGTPLETFLTSAGAQRRAQSVPLDVPMILRPALQSKTGRRPNKVASDMVCGACATTRETKSLNGELDEWISCNGCRKWFHVDCAGFKKSHEIRDVDKYFCAACEPEHGKTTYVRKSTRAHASVDYAELQRGVLKTSEESVEHHYIQPIKDGTFQFDLENFPRMRPEMVTKDFFQRSNTFVEPICIPAEWNPRPWLERIQKGSDTIGAMPSVSGEAWSTSATDEFEYDTVDDHGQDKLDMVMPQDLTVRQVCNLVGPDTPLDVIDVKTQNSGSKWTLSRWADYYEAVGEDKQICNVISLEVSQTKLGRLLRRPQIVRDLDLQDDVWPAKETSQGRYPKVQFYCLMSVADSYTDFHIDFGGSSVYYHILKGKKTFLFIPPKAKHLKAYEEWNDSPQQNYTFLPSITNECYRVDLSEGDTMLIPSGWIHAVWTPATSLVIGGNFLSRLSYRNQFKVVDIEKANETPMKFRYPYFQKIMWYTVIKYLEKDPIPSIVSQQFYDGKQFEREVPIWADFDGSIAAQDSRPGAQNARYYPQAEMDGLPELVNFIFRTVMVVMGRVEGVTADRIRRVGASIPKGYGEPLELAQTFALWVAWKRGNEDPPAWAHPDAVLPNTKDDVAPKKLSARTLKEMERKEAIASNHVIPDRQSERIKNAAVVAASAATSQGQIDPHADQSSRATINGALTPQNTLPKPELGISPPQSSGYSFKMQTPNCDSSPISHPMVIVNGLTGQHLSTPKTSVLGPKRVACDACRKRRIKCKHKEAVLQAPNGFSPFQQPMASDQGSDAHPTPPLHDSITVTPSQFQVQSSTYSPVAPNGTPADGHVASDSAVFDDSPLPYDQEPANGLSPLPGTNAYINANIPMTMNGVPIFGEVPKRGRSKACLECRKSKVGMDPMSLLYCTNVHGQRRCVHDENGNIDPVKAAETPMPRGSLAIKKRNFTSDGRPTNQSNSVANLQPQINTFHAQQPLLGSGFYQTYPSSNPNIDPALAQPPTTNSYHSYELQQEDNMAIDPNLSSMYAERAEDSKPAHNVSFESKEVPQPYGLPSLEEIANEVLDIDGPTQEASHGENGTAEFQREVPDHVDTLDTRETVAAATSISSGEGSRGDDAADSAISIQSGETQREIPLVVEKPTPAVDQSLHHEDAVATQLSPGHGMEAQDQSEAPGRSPLVYVDSMPDAPSAEGPRAPDQTAKPAVQTSIPLESPRDGVDGLSFPSTPVDLAQTPRKTHTTRSKSSAISGRVETPAVQPKSNKRKRDAGTEVAPSPTDAKQTKPSPSPHAKGSGDGMGKGSSGPHKSVEASEKESLELAMQLQKEALGLRRRG